MSRMTAATASTCDTSGRRAEKTKIPRTFMPTTAEAAQAVVAATGSALELCTTQTALDVAGLVTWPMSAMQAARLAPRSTPWWRRRQTERRRRRCWGSGETRPPGLRARAARGSALTRRDPETTTRGGEMSRPIRQRAQTARLTVASLGGSAIPTTRTRRSGSTTGGRTRSAKRTRNAARKTKSETGGMTVGNGWHSSVWRGVLCCAVSC
mmetsp:Transcript_32890/g.81455  ORF Transcript_32890/g.81455 Transcript_32890/m.81455 type:complete len:210 (-) Transcript_32890:339-968(-)